MTLQDINVGTIDNDGTGDTLKAAWVKTKANFAELELRKLDADKVGNVRRLQCVALGGRAPVNINGGSGDGNRTTTEAQKLVNMGGRGGNIGGVKLMMVNWRIDSSGVIEGANSVRIAASMLIPLTGAARKLTFAGEINPLIGKGASVISDSGRDMQITPNEQVLFRTSQQVSTAGYTMVGGNHPASLSFDLSRSHTDSIIPANETADCGGRVHNNNSIGSYTPTNGANALFPYTPACVLGYSEKPQVAVFVIGDSNAYGTGDTGNGDGQGAIGYIERGLRSTAQGVTAGTLWVRSGGDLDLYNAGAAPQIFDAADYHTHFLQQLSGNSIASLTLAQMKQKTMVAYVAAKVRGLRTIQLASLPRTTSNANTTVAVGWEVGGKRDQYNAWAQSIVGQKVNSVTGDPDVNGEVYLHHYWDCNDLLADPATNLWLFASYCDLTGVHLTGVSHPIAGGRIATLANALTIEN